jgi:hypothetical protein
MESKRAAAPNGPQAAWPRCHRTNTKPRRRQRCTPPAASRRRPRAPAFWAVIAGEVRPKGQVRAKGQVRPKVGAGHRGPFLQAVQSHARAVHPRARFVRGRARIVHRRARPGHRGVQLQWAWSSLAFPFSVQCHPKVLRAVLPKEWPYDGKVWDPMAIASWNPGWPLRCSRAARQLSSLSRQEAHAILRPRSGRTRARCELVGRSQLWPEELTFKRKTGRSELGPTRKFSLRADVFRSTAVESRQRFIPSCADHLPPRQRLLENRFGTGGVTMGNGFGPGWDSAQIKISRSVHCSLVSTVWLETAETKQSAVALQCSSRHPRDIGKIGQTPVVTQFAHRVEHAPDAARQQRNA